MAPCAAMPAEHNGLCRGAGRAGPRGYAGRRRDDPHTLVRSAYRLALGVFEVRSGCPRLTVFKGAPGRTAALPDRRWPGRALYDAPLGTACLRPELDPDRVPRSPQRADRLGAEGGAGVAAAVSYTHLTLPTN